MLTTNQHLDTLIATQAWAVEYNFGVQWLANYLHQLDARDNGASLASLGLGKSQEEDHSNWYDVVTQDGTKDRNWRFETGIPEGSIAYHSLSGIMLTNGLCGSVSELADDLYNADAHPNIDGHILELNSGGGEGTAGRILDNAITDLKKPIVVHAHFSGSAAVMGTRNATEIMASSSMARFGSIGVFYSFSKKYRQWHQENVEDIYSKKSPEKNDAFRRWLLGDPSAFERMATELDDEFMAAMKASRPLKGDVSETLAGGMFSAKVSRRKGLIDSIGTRGKAIQHLRGHIAYHKKQKRKKKKK